MNKIFALVSFFAFMPPALADQQTPAGDRVIENPASGGALKFRVNNAGTKRDLLQILSTGSLVFGSSAYASITPVVSVATALSTTSGYNWLKMGSGTATATISDRRSHGGFWLNSNAESKSTGTDSVGAITTTQPSAILGSSPALPLYVGKAATGATTNTFDSFWTQLLSIDSAGAVTVGSTTSTSPFLYITGGATQQPQLNIIQNTTTRVTVAAASSVNAVTQGTVLGDAVIRTEGNAMHFTTNAGGSTALRINTNGGTQFNNTVGLFSTGGGSATAATCSALCAASNVTYGFISAGACVSAFKGTSSTTCADTASAVTRCLCAGF